MQNDQLHCLVSKKSQNNVLFSPLLQFSFQIMNIKLLVMFSNGDRLIGDIFVVDNCIKIEYVEKNLKTDDKKTFRYC